LCNRGPDRCRCCIHSAPAWRTRWQRAGLPKCAGGYAAPPEQEQSSERKSIRGEPRPQLAGRRNRLRTYGKQSGDNRRGRHRNGCRAKTASGVCGQTRACKRNRSRKSSNTRDVDRRAHHLTSLNHQCSTAAAARRRVKRSVDRLTERCG